MNESEPFPTGLEPRRPIEWKPVPVDGADRYEVSSRGQVRSFKGAAIRVLTTHKAGGLRAPHRAHLNVGLCINGSAKTFQVHRLVAIAFLGQPPSPEHQVNHRNGRPNDNRVENLEWVLPSENAAHAKRLKLAARGARHGRYTKPDSTPRGSLHWATKLTEEDVRDIRRRYSEGEPQAALADEYGVTRPRITNIINRRSWRHVE